MKFAALACALFACGGAGDDDMMGGPDGGVTGGDGSMTTDDSGMLCMKPALDQPWLANLVSGAVTGLAGAPRFTNTQRQTARTFLQNQLTQIGWTPQLHSYNTGANVYATIPSTTGETKQIVVGAHFDTVSGSPGANDNATGSAAVLAVARYLKDMNCRKFAVTVVFFDEEESGLFGSRAFAHTLQVANVHAVHTVDQVGWDQDNDLRFELELPTTTLETEYRAAAQTLGVPVTKTSTQGTDHQSFREKGFPAMGLTEEYVGNDTSPYRHMAQDTAATVEQSYLQLGSKLVALAVMNEL
ncbi:MAG TPA: M20/M25/M40 family metallo-hydrolase [Kofleriaceae bacterium]|nr:M20/M25/M40 family metallo-hydrolase [Kofleriaceae bacterium]